MQVVSSLFSFCSLSTLFIRSRRKIYHSFDQELNHFKTACEKCGGTNFVVESLHTNVRLITSFSITTEVTSSLRISYVMSSVVQNVQNNVKLT